jgi:dihydrofolate reductase
MEAIFAIGSNFEFGYKGELPWGYIPKDLKHFKDKTLGKVLLCGKNTYNNLPKEVFEGRTVKMVTREDTVDGKLFEGDHSNSVIIGGTSLLTLDNLEKCDTVWMTQVKGTFEADTYLGWSHNDLFWFWTDRLNSVCYEDEAISIHESIRLS